MRLSVSRVLLAAAGSLALSASAAAGGAPDWPNVDPRVAPALRGVLRQAANRFSTPECAALLYDFNDVRTGRPLAETLSRSGLGLEAWLRSVYFLSGVGRTGCTGRGTFAYTPVGSAVGVFEQWEYDRAPGETGWITNLRFTRTAGTATTSTYSIRS